MPSAQVTITQLPAAGAITGTEAVPIVQNGQTVQTTTGAIAASPAQNQTFITLNQQPTLPNSRSLSGSTGIGLVDGGAQSTLQITLNGASGALESLSPGFVVKTGGTVVARSLTTTANGIAIANPNGVAGNPQFSLSDTVGTINGLAGTGLMGVVGGSTTTLVEIQGTANQISIANGTGPGNPTIAITSNPTIPGTGAMIVPTGTSAQRPGGTNGQIRFNSDTAQYEVYQNGWVDLSTSSGTVDFYHNGMVVASGDGLNFVDSANIDLTVVDDPFNGWVDVTPNLTTTGVAAGAYGSQSNTLTATVDVYGRLSALAQTAIGNLPNAALQNSAVTFNGVTVSLGASGTITSNTTNAVTFNNSGAGDASGTTFNGSAARTISYNTLGAPSTTGTNASGTWNISISGLAATATSLAGGVAGSLPYQSGVASTTFLGIGASTTIMTSTGSAPQWSAASGITVGTATNIAGGAAGSVPYNTGSGATTFLGIGSSTFLLTSTGTAPQWSDPSGVTVGTATNAVNSGITLTSTNATFYPSFVANTSGNEPIRVASGLTFNPSTNTLTTTTFSGALSGNATTATTATNANNIAITASGTNASFYPVFVSATTGNLAPNVDADLTYNPSTNTLTAGTMTATTGIFGGIF